MPADASAEQSFPALSGRVIDNANLLEPADEQALAVKSAKLERERGHQFVIATVPSLEGKPIEEFSIELARHWKIGRKDHDDGVLLLVAPKERKVRIEVGYGLEASLKDEEAAEILRRDVLPRFREKRMRDGIFAGADAIISEISRA